MSFNYFKTGSLIGNTSAVNTKTAVFDVKQSQIVGDVIPFNFTSWNYSGTISYSVSNITLTGIAVNSSGRYVAVGTDNMNYVPYYVTSLDGITWSGPTSLGGSWITINKVAVNPSGLFVAVGAGIPGSTTTDVTTSSDGVTWSSVTNTYTYNSSTDIIWGGDKFVAVGIYSYFVGWTQYYYGVAITSSNGTSWTSAVQISPKSMRCVCYSVDTFVAGGDEGYITTSTDGTSWTSAVQVGSSTITWDSITNNGSTCIAVGHNGNGSTGRTPVYSISTNKGATWSTPTTFPDSGSLFGSVSYATMASIKYLQGTWMVVGGNNLYTYSTDNGATWTNLTYLNMFGSGNISAMAVNQLTNRIVLVGNDATPSYYPYYMAT